MHHHTSVDTDGDGLMDRDIPAKGQVGATVRLEHLWNKFCEKEAFCLFCAYPESGFTQDAADSVMHICSAHTKMITGMVKGKTEVFYKPVERKQAI